MLFLCGLEEGHFVTLSCLYGNSKKIQKELAKLERTHTVKSIPLVLLWTVIVQGISVSSGSDAEMLHLVLYSLSLLWDTVSLRPAEEGFSSGLTCLGIRGKGNNALLALCTTFPSPWWKLRLCKCYCVLYRLLSKRLYPFFSAETQMRAFKNVTSLFR